MTFRTKLLMLMIFGALVPLVVLTGIAAYRMHLLSEASLRNQKSVLLNEYDALIKAQVNTVISMLGIIDSRVQNGEISLFEAKKQGANLIRHLRYSTDGYFWADTIDGTNVVLLGRPVEGKSRIDLQDVNGKYIIKEIIEKGRQQGGGFTDYWFPKAEGVTALPKRSYSLEFKPWGWVVGTGNYIDDINQKTVRYEKNIHSAYSKHVLIFSSSAITIILICLGFGYVMITRRTADLEKEISERKQAEENLNKYYDDLEELVKERTATLEEKSLQFERSQTAMQYLLEDIHEVNKQLEQANEKLKEVDRLKSMFIASMSHELRTPLNSVIGFSSILINEWVGPVNDEQKKNLQSILRSGKHLLSLINDVIDVSKIEAGMIEVNCEDFELAELLAEVEQTFAKDAQDRKLSLSVQPLNLPMHTDRRRLLQCLLNLVSNGLKFTEHGAVTVTVLFDKVAGDVTFIVTDTGIGIGAEDQARLFQPFSRIQSHLTATVLGTGLGLYLTRKIVVEILQGEITVVSEPGSGSTFSMTIPVRIETSPSSAPPGHLLPHGEGEILPSP